MNPRISDIPAVAPRPTETLVDVVVEALLAPDRREGKPLPCPRHLPSRAAVLGIVADLRSILFPGFFGATDVTQEELPTHFRTTLENLFPALTWQIQRSFCFHRDISPEDCADEAASAASAFLTRLPDLRSRLALDVQAALDGDPAARGPEETVLCYPGVLAITSHRIAHELFRLGVPILPRLIAEHAHGATGIDIHPGATIGKRFFIDHGTGVVIGETAVIGDNVRLYQGVTLGAKSFPVDGTGAVVKGLPRHPVVEDDVVIYSGATVLGRITIGRGSVIGGNVWVTKSVPPGTRVTQAVAGRESWAEGGGI
ncbi:MAG: serine acetyltransferase [Planctomycetia bacterium]|nr:serine acetyltransferase [Planctomycetia bacterium]